MVCACLRALTVAPVAQGCGVDDRARSCTLVLAAAAEQSELVLVLEHDLHRREPGVKRLQRGRAYPQEPLLHL